MSEQPIPSQKEAIIGNSLEINFLPIQPKYVIQTTEYQSLWHGQGPRIVDAFKSITGLPFTEQTIDALVGETKDGYSHSGHPFKTAMLFRQYSRDKLPTIVHELAHRFISEHGLWEKAHDKFGLKNPHQLLDLFYYEIIKSLYGEEAANERIVHESEDKNPQYKESWEWFLNMKPEDRTSMRSQILALATPEQKE